MSDSLCSVYCDGVHLWADDLARLHRFAGRIGLKPEWFQERGAGSHYDLTTPAMVRKAFQAGASPITTRAMVRLIQTESAQSA